MGEKVSVSVKMEGEIGLKEAYMVANTSFQADGGEILYDQFYIDLVFYNYILKCFLLIDLKTEKLTPQGIGKMDFYIRFFEDQLKQPGDNPTIGLILCTKKDKTIAKYSLLNESKQIFASKYQLYLPTAKQLEQEIKRERDQIEQESKLNS